MAYGKSVSEPSSPQLWHKGTNILMLQKSGRKFTKDSHINYISNYKLGIQWFSFECQREFDFTPPNWLKKTCATFSTSQE